MKNYKEKIQKLKENIASKKGDGETAEAFEKVFQSALLKLPNNHIKKIIDKLALIEEGAAADQTGEEIIELLKDEGIEFEEFASKDHQHGEFKDFLKIVSFERFKDLLMEQCERLFVNLQESDKKVIEIERAILTGKDNNEAEIKDILKKIKNIKPNTDHSKLENLEWSKAGHKIDTDLEMDNQRIIGLGKPEKGKDAANKDYVDSVAQRAAGMNRGGGTGIYVQRTAPINVPVNQLWVQI